LRGTADLPFYPRITPPSDNPAIRQAPDGGVMLI